LGTSIDALKKLIYPCACRVCKVVYGEDLNFGVKAIFRFCVLLRVSDGDIREFFTGKCH
jgi:hypothetical protein